MDVLGRDHRRRARGERKRGDPGKLGRAKPQQHLRQQLSELRFHRHAAGETAGVNGHLAREDGGYLLVGAVLQQLGEEQVPGFQQGEVLFVLHLAGGQQPGRLQVEQGGRDHQEKACLVQVPSLGTGSDIRDELIGHLGQGNLGDVQLVLGDQAEQQVERSFEDVKVDLESTRFWGLCGTATRIAGHCCGHCGPAGPPPAPVLVTASPLSESP